jgi:hypothetical protein
MNTRIFKIITIFTLGLIFYSCNKDEEIDTEKPFIDLEYTSAFPSYCDTIYFGESFNLKAFFSDNIQLGAFSIDVHNNFDHHTHAYKIEKCELDPVKQANNPFVLIDNYEIPTNLTEHVTDLTIDIPASNDLGLFDEGDYCFHIYLTDKEGWSTPSVVSVKMLYRAN